MIMNINEFIMFRESSRPQLYTKKNLYKPSKSHPYKNTAGDHGFTVLAIQLESFLHMFS
jgi:hypothetical protein